MLALSLLGFVLWCCGCVATPRACGRHLELLQFYGQRTFYIAMQNWAKMQAKMGAGRKRKGDPPKAPSGKRHEYPSAATAAAPSSSTARPAPALPHGAGRVTANELTPRLALDCEMVGVGTSGHRSALAHVVVVNFDEQIVYCAFVKPPEPITDFRTDVSGVRPEHMIRALPLRQVQAEVAELMRERTIIGHALNNDLKALMLQHPKSHVRDTAHYPPYRKQRAIGSAPRKLQALALDFLGWAIQGAEHSPSEDAVAALRLYKLKARSPPRRVHAAACRCAACGTCVPSPPTQRSRPPRLSERMYRSVCR